MLFSFLDFVLVFAKFFRCYAVDPLEYFIEIGDRAKANIIADRRYGVVRILQLEGCLLQADLVQVFGHRIPGVLSELPA
jgi:hypothetical protein